MFSNQVNIIIQVIELFYSNNNYNYIIYLIATLAGFCWQVVTLKYIYIKEVIKIQKK